VNIGNAIGAEGGNVRSHAAIAVDQDVDALALDQIGGGRLQFVRREIADIEGDDLDCLAEQSAAFVDMFGGQLDRLFHGYAIGCEISGDRYRCAKLDHIGRGKSDRHRSRQRRTGNQFTDGAARKVS